MRKLLYQTLVSLCGLLLLAHPALAVSTQAKIGVLITSYGDIDDPSELRDYVVRTLKDPDIIPLPSSLRWMIAELGYPILRNKILEEYAAIGGNTKLRRNTRLQAAKVAADLRERGFDAQGYVGFSMTFPFISEALEQAQLDDVDTLVVLYQGAQYSQVTSFIQFREVEAYLSKHPEWRVKVVGVKSFSEDPRFVEMLISNIEKTWQQHLPGVQANDVCIFLPLHGQIESWLTLGDPYFDQVIDNIDVIKYRFADSYVSYGFQNHDEMPFIKWTQPSWHQAIDDVARQDCTKVIISGQVSYTIDSLETLYDHNIAMPQRLTSQAELLNKKKEYVMVPMFNDDQYFAQYLAQISVEALEGEGDIVQLGTGALSALDLKSNAQ